MVTKEEMKKLPKIVAVDFDGCLVSDNFPAIGEVNKDLFRICKELQKQGVKLILWTSRNGGMLYEALDCCYENGLHFDAVNKNLPEVIELFGGDTRKVHADLYIDDKAIPHLMHPAYWQDRIGVKIT